MRAHSIGMWIGAAVASSVMAGRPEPTPPPPSPAATALEKPTSQSRIALSHELPPLNGERLEATLVEVTYPPGGANPAHRHPCPVVGYVLEGSLRMRVKGRPEAIYRAGDTFYESPNDVHLVSENASPDAPARFLAYFVCDHETPLSIPLSEDPAGGR